MRRRQSSGSRPGYCPVCEKRKSYIPSMMFCKACWQVVPIESQKRLIEGYDPQYESFYNRVEPSSEWLALLSQTIKAMKGNPLLSDGHPVALDCGGFPVSERCRILWVSQNRTATVLRVTANNLLLVRTLQHPPEQVEIASSDARIINDEPETNADQP